MMRSDMVLLSEVDGLVHGQTGSLTFIDMKEVSAAKDRAIQAAGIDIIDREFYLETIGAG